MATTTGSFTFYEKGLGKLVGGAIDLDTPDIRILLTTSAYTPNAATHEFVSNVTNELSGNGYTRLSLVNEAKSHVGAGVWMLDSDNPVWTASGGAITARYFVLFDYNAVDSAAPLIGFGFIDNTPADVSVPDTETLTLVVHENGWFRWNQSA